MASEKSRKIVKVSGICFVLCALVAAVAVGITSGRRNHSNEINTSSKAIIALCQPTHYKDACINSLQSANTSNVQELVRVGFQAAANALKDAIKNSSTLQEAANKDSRTNQALKNCEELMNSAIEDLQASSSKLGANEGLDDYITHQLNIWLSGALTFEETCLDEFENITNNDIGEKIRNILQAARELTSNGLNMVAGLSPVLTSTSINRRLLADDNGYPSWVSSDRRKLLAAIPTTMKPNAIVAKDGSGQFKTITDALKVVPLNNAKTFVIYIKEGVYQESVKVTNTMTNVMFLGDGATKTKITGSKNFVDGVGTIESATVAIVGNNFMAKDIGFENSAGAIKHQAVALLVQSDKSVFYRCQMDGYQDTLFAIAHAQFYRDCTISGTQDFIFGDAAVVFQNCKIVIRKPLPKQNCYVTAQGREELSSVTGIVLQNCVITGDPAYQPVKNENKAYLGRPWKQYARTIIMQSQIDDVIQPEGWFPWHESFALDTCYYAEFDNRGPGAVQTGRVTWKGIKHIDANQADSFTVAKFLQEDWIKLTGVPYVSKLM